MPVIDNYISILVVEDDRLTRKILESFFQALELPVIMAEDGETGLQIFRDGDFDIVISDYNLPAMNGLEMFKEIKKESPSTKLVLMTIYTESEVLIKAINMGVDRFIEKPLYKDNLKKVLDILSEDILTSKELVRHQNLLKAYRLGVDSSTIFSLLDKDGNFTYANENFCFISEYSEPELIGRHYSTVRKTNNVYDVTSFGVESDDNERMWQGCITNVTKSGYEYVTEVSLLPLKENGQVSGFISIEKDMSFVVSQHKKQLQSFFDADSSILFALDDDLEINICNKSFLDFFGFENSTDANLKEFCLQDYVHQIEGEKSLHMIDSRCKSLKEMVKRYKVSDISKLVLKKNNDDKEYFFMLNMFELDQSYLGLNNLLIIRMNDITEIENLKKEEMASAMLVSIGKLAAGITHEINTPLTYIKGNIELLQWDIESIADKGSLAEMQEYFNSINDGISRISLIIESMKEVTGEAKFEMEESNLYSTFAVAGRMVFNRSKHIAPIFINGEPMTLDFDANSENLPAMIAPKMLEQVWIILLNNALDQLSQSGLTFEEKYIKINIERFENRYKIYIRDNGGGIADDVLKRIFNLFASTKKHKGMGIGLNIAKNIIEKHNGTINPYNDDVGAVFEITL